MARSLATIAREIRSDWKNVYFGAVPYLQAMSSLNSMQDMYYADDARSIVLYFLSNATTWRGPVAKRIKLELKAMLAGKDTGLSGCECGLGDHGVSSMIALPDHVAAAALLVLRRGLGFEIRGMRMTSKGPTAYAIIKREFGLRGSKQSVFDQFTELLRQQGILR